VVSRRNAELTNALLKIKKMIVNPNDEEFVHRHEKIIKLIEALNLESGYSEITQNRDLGGSG
jgi:hypothetical protein